MQSQPWQQGWIEAHFWKVLKKISPAITEEELEEENIDH